MKQTARKNYIRVVSILLGIPALIISCANVGSPGGGEPDYDPPKLAHTSPGLNATNVKSRKVEIFFDENVKIENPSEKIIVTPPQRLNPVVRSVNRKVTVLLRDTLLPNTTYTIDFTDAISDNNEGNVLENFSYSFSTGDVVDTLAMSGKVVDARNLEPLKGIYVGLHSNLNDTAFTKTKFERISRTNEKGEFTIRGIAAGKYKVYALDDPNRLYMYENPSSAIAFLDTLIQPSSVPDSHPDTVFTVKDGKPIVDTVLTVNFTRFLPDNVVLRSFVSNFKRRYLQKYERTHNQLVLYFGAATDMPLFEPLSFDKKRDWAVLEKTAGNDTLKYWIKDSLIMKMDTLAFKVTYLKTDSLNVDEIVTDTLLFTERGRKKKDDKKKKKDEEDEIPFLNIKTNLNQSWEIYNDITFETSEPITESLTGKVKLQKQIDSTFIDVEGYTFREDTLNPRLYTLKYKWNYNDNFKLTIDSAVVKSIYGLYNKPINQTFKVKGEDTYGTILIWIEGLNGRPAFVELLSKSDIPVRKVKVRKDAVLFRNLNPGEYYARIVLDDNDNGVWDTGNFFEHRQPELVFYYDKVFNLRAYMELQETWKLDISNSNAYKPAEVLKNKPKDKKTKKQQIEERERKKEEEEERMRREGQQRKNRDPYGSSNFDNIPQYGSRSGNRNY